MVTLADIQAAAKENPALVQEIANGFAKEITPILANNDEVLQGIFPLLKQKGFSIRSKDEETSFLETHKKSVVETEIPNRIKEVHDRYDEDLFELTGERKAPTEKTYDFMKRKINEIKSAQIADPVIKEQLNTLRTNLENKEREYKATIAEMETKHFKREIEMISSAALSSINIAIPAHITTDDEKQKYVEQHKAMIKNTFLNTITAKRDNDGNVVFYEGDKPLTSTTDGKPLSAMDIIKSKYGLFIAKDEGRQQGGAGSGAGGGKTVFTSKNDVVASLEAKGLKQGTQAFYNEYEKACKDSGLL